MLIESQAGEFEIDIKSFERKGDMLVMVGAMGVWEARTHFTPRDVAKLLGIMLSSGAVWHFVLMLPFRLIGGAARGDKGSAMKSPGES